jgi:hypothetical protein
MIIEMHKLTKKCYRYEVFSSTQTNALRKFALQVTSLMVSAIHRPAVAKSGIGGEEAAWSCGAADHHLHRMDIT